MSSLVRISEISDLVERQHALDYLGTPDINDISPVRVLYYGHSFVGRIQDYIKILPVYRFNFGMDLTEAAVYFQCDGGATLDRLRSPGNLSKLKRVQPEIVVIEGGTNDLAREDLSPKEVADEMLELCRDILDCRAREVVVSQVLLRGKAGMKRAVANFEEKVYEYNHRVEDALEFLPRASFWHHYKLWRNIEDHVITDDGTHLNDLGHKKLYKSLCGAIRSTTDRIRPAWRVVGHL